VKLERRRRKNFKVEKAAEFMRGYCVPLARGDLNPVVYVVQPSFLEATSVVYPGTGAHVLIF
jgi:hypothetical protein